MIRNMQDVWPNIFGAFGDRALQNAMTIVVLMFGVFGGTRPTGNLL